MWRRSGGAGEEEVEEDEQSGQGAVDEEVAVLSGDELEEAVP